MAGYRPEEGRAPGGRSRPRHADAGSRSRSAGYPGGPDGYRRGETSVREAGGRPGDPEPDDDEDGRLTQAWGGSGGTERWQPGVRERGERGRDRYDGRRQAAGYGDGRRQAAGYGDDGRQSAGYGDGGPWAGYGGPGRPPGTGRTGAGPRGAGRAARRTDPTGGAEGNERLTAMTGAVLLVLLAAEGFTILAIRQLLTPHVFIGMLLVGPVALKAGSTVYRFVRYYTGAPDYRRKGPPTPLLRLLGPFVLLLSLAVIGSGIMLAVVGPDNAGLWMLAHKASFVLWFGAMTIHVLAYVWRLPSLISGDLTARAGRRAGEVIAGRRARWLMLTASVLTGVLLAVLTVHWAGAWSGFAGG